MLILRPQPVLLRSLSRAMSSRTYKAEQDAIERLNTLQSNAATLEALRNSKGRLSDYAIPEMIEYLGRIGYVPEDLNKLNVIHVTGTKGKGSTCAFVDSILRKNKPCWKIGLYTSPHLIAVRERIRINGAPISEEDFAKYFFDVWDRLEANDADPITTPKPMYFRYLTLVAYHAFLDLKVDATILEVGIGGLHDSTNIVPAPVVTGVSSLGLDHVNVLGNTIGEIAFQKGGIYKEGVPAFSVPQPENGVEVLQQQAYDRKASSFVVTPSLAALENLQLGLAGRHQLSNANLAVHLAASFISTTTNSVGIDPVAGLPQEYVDGLKEARWPARCQRVEDPVQSRLIWFLDGAHTKESLQCCMEWYVSPHQACNAATSKTLRILVFNCTSGRSGKSFLSTMFSTASAQLASISPQSEVSNLFDRVIFSTNVTYADGHFKGDLAKVALTEAEIIKTQRELAETFAELFPTFPPEQVTAAPSIEHAVASIHSLLENDVQLQVLVCGSLHLVGGVIEVAGLADVALNCS